MKKIIISVTNDLSTDQRVHRTCTTLLKLNLDVLLVGRNLNSSLPVKRSYKTKRFRLVFNKGFLFYSEYNIRLFFFLLFNRNDFFYANDIDTIIPNLLISQFKRKPLIFDSHELFSEVPELINRPFVKLIWKKIEDIFIPKIKYKITVSDSIALHYKNIYNTHFEVIRNIPQPVNSESNGNKNVILQENAIIYQGSLNKGRGLELMIETMNYIDNSIFYIVGEGDITDELKKLVKSLKFDQKVVFIGKIDPIELNNITAQASIGISLEEDLGLNYRYALPNKLFDYIQAKIPVLVSNLPEMKQLVNQYKIGEIINDRNPKAIGNQIKFMLENTHQYQKNLEIAAEELNWEKEEEKLISIIHKIDSK